MQYLNLSKLNAMKRFLPLLLLVGTLNLNAQFRFLPEPDPQFFPERSVMVPITATTAYQGYDETQAYFGEGEYEIFLDVVDGILDNPIIVLDGFDPGDSRDISGLYASLSFGGENMADILRDEGYDIVILNAPQYVTDGKEIDGGADYIQRNALVLVSLIEEINAQKEGDNELVVLGPSMGGLIGRYALAYMEENSIPHETRLYISFDSPHRGANIPISLQYLINYFAQEIGDPTALAVVEQVLFSPAAKEMLVDHLEAHLLSGSNFEQDPNKLLPEGAPDFRDAFQAELDALGFPQNVRNVTMINGSGNGTQTGTPGMEVVNTNLTIDASTDVDVALYFTPEAGQTNTVTDLTAYFIGIPVASYSADAESPATTDGVDSAPGGTASISDALDGGGGNPVLIEFLDALQQDLYNFIPTLSALAIETDNWYEIPNLNDSPFVNFYIPNENEDHVTVTAESAQFALDEIRLLLGTDEFNEANNWVLAKNPVNSTLELAFRLNESEVIELKLYDLSGRLVYDNRLESPSGEISLPLSVPSGFYLLIAEQGERTQTLKLLVK